MSAKPVKSVLLVDNDLGFVFWLGHALDAAGCEAIPAQSIRDAVSVVTEHNFSPDVLVVNPSLTDAARFVADLRCSQPHTKVIAVTAASQAHRPDFPVDGIRSKPDQFGEDTRSEWVHFIQTISTKRSSA